MQIGEPMKDQSSTGPALEKLLEQARQAALHSYSPYSGFRVGAALRLANGEVVTGTNVENVSYGLTICAERSALVQAVSEFGPGIRVQAVAVLNCCRWPSRWEKSLSRSRVSNRIAPKEE
jgi:cytidine deaminase